MRKTPRILISLGCLVLGFLLYQQLANNRTKYESTPSWASPSAPHPELPEQQLFTPPDKGPKQAAFVAYNLQNYLEQPTRTGSETLSSYKSEVAIRGIINTLKLAQPVILGVCEIGTEQDLKDLQQRLKQANIDLPYSYHTKGSDPLRHLGMLSRYPIRPHPHTPAIYTARGMQYTMKRGILDVSVQLPGQSIRFLGLHLKSKLSSPYLDHNLIRRHEAQIVRQHIDKLLKQSPSTPLILYGDINDSKQSPSFKAIQGNPRSSNYLYPFPLEASNKSRWTHHWGHSDNYSRIDFILANATAKRLCSIQPPSLYPLSIEGSGSDHRALQIMIHHH